MSEAKIAFRQMSQEERRKTLAPGEVATGFDAAGRVISRVVGRVPWDGSTRQQRRAAVREARG
jgi:hypothetical protein